MATNKDDAYYRSLKVASALPGHCDFVFVKNDAVDVCVFVSKHNSEIARVDENAIWLAKRLAVECHHAQEQEAFGAFGEVRRRQTQGGTKESTRIGVEDLAEGGNRRLAVASNILTRECEWQVSELETDWLQVVFPAWGRQRRVDCGARRGGFRLPPPEDL